MIKITANQVLATKELIYIIEESNGVQLPESYVSFLLEYNGGTPERNISQSIYIELIEFFVQEFYGIRGKEDLQLNIDTYKDRMPYNTIPIASVEGGNLLCMSFQSDTFGFIYFWNHELVDDLNPILSMLDLVSKSFDEFLIKSLKKYIPSNNPLEGYEVVKGRVDPDFLTKLKNGKL